MYKIPKQNTINKELMFYLCLHFPAESCHILLLSNLLDFVPCDLQLQRAHFQFMFFICCICKFIVVFM